MHVHDVNERAPRFSVRRVFLPARATESFTVTGLDLRPLELVDEYLAGLPAGAQVHAAELPRVGIEADHADGDQLDLRKLAASDQTDGG